MQIQSDQGKYHESWRFRKRFWPKKSEVQNDIYKYFIQGFDGVKIKKSDHIISFGSCFARNISEYLNAKGYTVNDYGMKHNSVFIRHGEGLSNPRLIREQIEWIYGRDYRDKSIQYPDEARTAMRLIVDKSDVFIITLGLSEIFINANTGEACWKYEDRMKSSKEYGFIEPNYPMVIDDLLDLCELLKNKFKKIIFTLSPVPLLATFRDMPITSASEVSKAALRLAIDRIVDRYQYQAAYFPSYEIARWYDPYKNKYDEDYRHLDMDFIIFIMEIFEKYYCD